MPTYITNESNYELPPAGLHPAVCVDYVDDGFKPTQFGDKHKVHYVFQIEEKNSKGYRYTVSSWFNLSMHENSTLRQFLEKWRAKAFTEADLKPPGFDLESVIGVPCTLSIVHNASNGKTYANIDSIAPHSARLGSPLEPEGYTRVEEREQAKQAMSAGATHAVNRSAEPPLESDGIEDDFEIPF